MIVNSLTNKGFLFQLLSTDDIRRIHNASLEILDRTGVVIHAPEALALLTEAGAIVDGNRAYLPAWMIEEAVRNSPSRVVLSDTTGKRTMFLDDNNVYFGLGTDQPMFRDVYTGEIRPAMLKDTEDAAKLGQWAESIDYIAPIALAGDKHPKVADLYHFLAMRTYSKKPNLTLSTDKESLKGIIDMAAAQAGGYDALRKNPTLYHYCEPVSPLVFSVEAVEKLMLCADYGIPVTCSPGAMSGGTAPMSLAGTLALGNAEVLAGLVIHQLRCKGAPFIYGLSLGLMDMKTTIDIYGGPEVSMMCNLATGQLARFYQLPSFGMAGASDSNEIDAQNGYESMFSNLTGALGGVNMLHDNGYMGAGLIGCLEKILLDEEIVSYVRRFMTGIQVTDESLCVDLIDKIGPGGEFVSDSHTAKNFKKEMWYPKFANRKQYQAWQLEGSVSLTQKLREKAIHLIESECPKYLTEDELKAFEDIIYEREKQLAL